MSLVQRLRRIETSLTPKQAVLVWLKEAQQLGIVGYMEKSFNSPAHELPRARLTEMVGRAVRESLCQQGMKPELTVRASREARKQTDFLIVLIRNVHREVYLECLLNAPYIVLLYEKFERLLEHFIEHDRFVRTTWELWRTVLIVKLSGMWRLRETIVAISERYCDHHPLLFPEDASRFDQHIDALEKLTKHYNSLEGGLPAWTAIDCDALASSIREQVLAEVAERVAHAKSTTLEDFGESEAARKLVEPYALAALKRLGDSRSMQQGGD